VAAGRNFKSLIARLGKEKSAAFVSRALERISVDVTAFTGRRPLAPNADVIFDRAADRYFVDPTFNSPSEARYLLSLATWYEAEMERFRIPETIADLDRLQRRISEMENATLGESDERTLEIRKSKAAEATRSLFDFALHVTKDPAFPR
jgi:hypothetical protein